MRNHSLKIIGTNHLWTEGYWGYSHKANMCIKLY